MIRAVLLAIAALSLTACAGNLAVLKAATALASDPRCAHDDKLAAVTGAGGLPASVQISVERHCPAALNTSGRPVKQEAGEAAPPRE